MSRENVELVVRHFEDTNAEDVAGAVGAFADDIVLRFHGDLATLAGEGEDGKTAVVEWFLDWFRTFEPGYRFEVEEMRDWGGATATPTRSPPFRPPGARSSGGVEPGR